MKLQGIDRILLAVYAALTALALVAFGMFVIVPDAAVHLAQTMRNYLTDSFLMQVAGLLLTAVLIAWSVHVVLIALGKAGASAGSVSMQAAEEGGVRVSVRAMESLVRYAVGEVEGVLDSKISVVSSEGSVTVEIDMTAAIGTHVPELTALLQRNVRRVVEEYSGVPVRGVRVLVTDLRDNGPAALPPPVSQESQETAGTVLVEPEKVEHVRQDEAGA